jgi:hypothetical protein
MNSYFANVITGNPIAIFSIKIITVQAPVIVQVRNLLTRPLLFTTFGRIKDKMSKTSIHIKDSTRRAN